MGLSWVGIIGNFQGIKMFGRAKHWLWWIGIFHGANNIGGLIGRKFLKGKVHVPVPRVPVSL